MIIGHCLQDNLKEYLEVSKHFNLEIQRSWSLDSAYINFVL